MKRRPRAERPPAFDLSDVYKLVLYGRDEYVRRWGEPSPELLAAVAEREARRSEHRQRSPTDWREDAP